MIPQPTDSLIMQIITELIYPLIKKNQPSTNSFYSRDRHFVSKPHEVVSGEYDKDWKKQWKRMQK